MGFSPRAGRCWVRQFARSDHFKTALMGVGQSPWTPNGTVDTTRSIITQCPLWHLLSIISCNFTESQLNDDRNGGQYSFAFETAKKERNYSIYPCKENSKEKSVFCFLETTQIWLNRGISPSTQCVGSNTWHQVCQGKLHWMEDFIHS